MSAKIFTLITLLVGVLISYSQEDKVIQPVVLDISGKDLTRIKLKDQPSREFFQKRLYGGSELSVYMISSETASKHFESFPIDEYVYLLNGKAKITPQNEESYEFYTGDHVIGTKGFKGDWGTIGGNQYHLELSVISNKRSTVKSIKKKQKPFSIDRDLLSGIHLNFTDNQNLHRNIVYEGSEIIVTLEAENSRNIEKFHAQKEEFIFVLSGSVSLELSNGNSFIFQSGDAFVLPKEFIGKWYSRGIDLLRTIRVTAIES